MFLDEVTIQVAGGKGGDGCVAWHREKYVDHGGPDGGDGGDGGSVVIQASSHTDTLSVFMTRKKFSAKPGEHGTGKCKAGARGENVVLFVPPGTTVSLQQSDGSQRKLADLKTHGEETLVAKGGRGGYGNAHFTSSVRQAPDFAELGEPGELATIQLELKLVADVGIIGYPSVGKSSLIAAVSNARPKIADYPFTTLVPNLGVVRVSGREMVLCDIPGLIEGASEGKGLGHHFLRHIERCAVLVHLLDITRDDILSDYASIRTELKKYSPILAKKKQVVVLNKCDLVGGDALPWIDALKKKKVRVSAVISAATHFGTEKLLKDLLPIVLKEREKRIADDASEQSAEIPVLRPAISSDKMGAYTTEKAGSIIRVTGKRLEQFTSMTDFSNAGGRQRFIDVLDRIGLIRELDRIALPGDEVWIGSTNVSQYVR